MTARRLIVATRGSALALWQTQHVVQALQALSPELEIEVKTISTQGDRVRDRALSQVGGKGLFVTDIEQALLLGEVDAAVHSLKDMPAELSRELVLGALLERADPRDALVVRGGEGTLATLPTGARVGTSSLRRRAQLLAARPDLRVLDLRGNVDTRLRRLRQGNYEAVVLAAAGLVRLGHADAIAQMLPMDVMLPAVGQGTLCIEARAGDEGTLALIQPLDHLPTRQAAMAERALLRRLQGGCQVPIGAYAHVDEGALRLRGMVASLDGSRLVRDEISGPPTECAQLGAALAEDLLSAGGEAILEAVRSGS